MTKGNIRSFRYSDRVREILDKQEGNSLNEKFEKLVLYCNDSVPKIKKDIARWDKALKDKQRAYNRAYESLAKINDLIRTLEGLERLGNQAVQQASKVLLEDSVAQ